MWTLALNRIEPISYGKKNHSRNRPVWTASMLPSVLDMHEVRFLEVNLVRYSRTVEIPVKHPVVSLVRFVPEQEGRCEVQDDSFTNRHIFCSCIWASLIWKLSENSLCYTERISTIDPSEFFVKCFSDCTLALCTMYEQNLDLTHVKINLVGRDLSSWKGIHENRKDRFDTFFLKCNLLCKFSFVKIKSK